MLAKNGPKNRWSQLIDTVVWAYNGAIHTATQTAPGEAFMDKEWPLDCDRDFAIQRTAIPQIGVNEKYWQHMKHQADKKRWHEFQPNERVMLVRRPAQNLKHDIGRRWRQRKEGPFTIIEYLGKKKYLASDGLTQHILNGWELLPLSHIYT